MNKLKIKEEKVINIDDDTSLEFYFYHDSNFSYVFHLGKNSNLVVYHYVNDSSSSIEVNLDKEGAEVEYHFSTFNIKDNSLKFLVNHNASHTISNIYNHGVNKKDKILSFDIIGRVLDTSDQCICNQENQIINLEDGKSTILPKLLIDQFDVNSSHSAYIGKFSDEQIFYLMSRGISKKSSYDLLIKALLINGGDTSHSEVSKMIESTL